MNKISLNKTLYKIRRERGMSQEDIAERLKISVTSYRKIEKGTTPLISDRAYEIAEALNIPFNQFLLEDNSEVKLPSSQIESIKEIFESQLTTEREHYNELFLQKEKIIKKLEELVSTKSEIIDLLKEKLSK